MPVLRVARAAVIAALAAVVVGGCVKVSIPPSDIDGIIYTLEVDGQLRSADDAIVPAKVDLAARTIEIRLSESVDVREVCVAAITLSKGAACELAEGSVIDLSQPYETTVTTHSPYEWTITATQSIEYRFEVAGQVGESIFEMHSRSVFAYVPVGTDMSAIEVVDLKLAPEGVATTYAPSLGSLLGEPQAFVEPSKGGSRVREIEVRYRDAAEKWFLYVTEKDVQMERVNPFVRRAYLSAFGADGAANSFEYRPAEGFDPNVEEEVSGWIAVPQEMMTEGRKGVFTATLTGLEPQTEYLVRALSGESVSDYLEFATTEARVLPGASFEDWNFGVDDRKYMDGSNPGIPGVADTDIMNIEAWGPWPANGVWEQDRWWDTGNRGVAFVDRKGGGNSLCTKDGYRGNGAELETRWAIVKVAGGNIYFGEFGQMFGLNATCRLGHNWQTKPSRLQGYYKYAPKPIDKVSADHNTLHPYKFPESKWMGSPDSLHVCVALWASPDGQNVPFVVDTRTANGGRDFLDFSRDKDGVIAYGAFVSAEEQADWDLFDIALEYFDEDQMSATTRNYLDRCGYFTAGTLPPNTQLYLLITASKNCNYFIAGTGDPAGTRGSTMWVDELEMIYE